MRGVKAKALRRLAERATVGQPAVAYEWATEMVTRKGKDGKPIRVQAGHIVLQKKCTRAVYKASKAMYKEVRRAH